MNKKNLTSYMNKISKKREFYLKLNKTYYKTLQKIIDQNITTNTSILEVGCGIGNIIGQLKAEYKVGIDISDKMIKIANSKFTDTKFIVGDIENYSFKEKFDYIIISDTLCYFYDVQKALNTIKQASNENTRIIITYTNFTWNPILKVAELLKLKMPQPKLNWLGKNEINNLLKLENYDIITSKNYTLIPIFIPLISWFFNSIIIRLPFLKHFSLFTVTIARINHLPKDYSVSIIIPVRNESGNIENALNRIPKFGSKMEVIFIEGGSTDDTFDQIKKTSLKKYPNFDIQYSKQTGKGKGDAVRLGYEIASNEILFILDGDLTVPPEELPKFYNAIKYSKAEFVNGTRLVYPLEKESMRFLNILGNKFFSLIFSWILEQPLKDTLCGTKVLSKSNWEKIKSTRSYFGDFDPFGDFDLLFGASKHNLKIIDVPIRYKARSYGQTNISRFHHGWILLKMTIFALMKLKFRK